MLPGVQATEIVAPDDTGFASYFHRPADEQRCPHADNQLKPRMVSCNKHLKKKIYKWTLKQYFFIFIIF